MFKRKNAVINENQNDKIYSLIKLIISHFKNVDFKNDNNVEKAESE